MEEPSQRLMQIFEKILKPADYLLHLGDMASYSILEYLETHPGFYGVAGNMDPWRVADELPVKRVVDLDGFQVGMVHGYGFWGDIPNKALETFEPGLDLLCYGHTHVFDFTRRPDTSFLNPGSLTQPRKNGPSLALVHVEADKSFTVEQVLL